MTKILIIEARFYGHLADMGLEGAKAAIEAAGATYDVVTVPGCLEIPAALLFAKDHYDGFVTLGCVIRGKTTHYEMVSNESFRGIYNIAHHNGLCVGNGIQTVENEAQAIERLHPEQMNKAGAAARAALRLIEIKKQYANG